MPEESWAEAAGYHEVARSWQLTASPAGAPGQSACDNRPTYLGRGAARPSISIDSPQKAEDLIACRGIRLRGRNLRQRAARGTIVNSAFSISLAAVAMVRGLLVAGFLTSADYGI